MSDQDRELVTVAQAAKRIKVSKRTLWNWMHQGRIPFVLTPGGRRRLYMDTLIRQPNQEGAAEP